MQSSIVCGISNLLFTEAFLIWKTSQEWILCTYSVESKLNIRKMFIWFPRCLMFASTNMLAARKLSYWFFMYFCCEYFTFYANLLSNRYFLICKLKQKLLDLFLLGKGDGRTNEFLVDIVYSGKLQPSQVVCTSHCGRYKILIDKIKCFKEETVSL